MTDSEQLKRAAATRAVHFVESGQRLGLGTGSTVAHFLELLGERLASGEVEDIVGVPTSIQTEIQATALGIPLADLEELQPLDLTVDGADEIDPSLNLIKGLGGALIREKMVACASKRLVIIGDASKVVSRLGEKAPLPVEVLTFAWRSHLGFLRDLGAAPVLRITAGEEPLVTDNGNFILDCHFEGGIPDPEALDDALNRRAGIVGSGLFMSLAEVAFVAGEESVVEMARDA